MGRYICCQRCGAVIISGSLVKESSKRKMCWKFCKIVLKNVVAEVLNDDWNHRETALYYRGRQGQVRAQIMSNNVPSLCRTCIYKAEVDAEAAAAAATEREAKAVSVVAAMKRKAEDLAAGAAAAAATAKREAETRVYCLMLMIGCFVCVSVSVGVCTWCFMKG